MKSSAQTWAERASEHRERAMELLEGGSLGPGEAIRAGLHALLAIDARLNLLAEVLAGPFDVRTR